MGSRKLPQCGFQTPPDSIADDRITELFGDGEPEPRAIRVSLQLTSRLNGWLVDRVCGHSPFAFKDKPGQGSTSATANALKLRPRFQRHNAKRQRIFL